MRFAGVADRVADRVADKSTATLFALKLLTNAN